MKKKQIFLIIMIIILIIPSIIFGFADEIGNPTPTPPDGMSDTVSTILGVIQWVGYAIAVGMLLYIGIKYVMAAANEKAELKQSLINFVIGAILVAGVTIIFTGIVSFFGVETNQDEGGIGTEQGTTTNPTIGGED